MRAIREKYKLIPAKGPQIHKPVCIYYFWHVKLYSNENTFLQYTSV